MAYIAKLQDLINLFFLNYRIPFFYKFKTKPQFTTMTATTTSYHPVIH
jgi:hypothetical protein